MAWKCVLIQPTDRTRRWLRRYKSNPNEQPCQAQQQTQRSYCNTMVQIEDGPCITDEKGYIYTTPMQWDRSDPRWPTKCQCGYEYKPENEWQLFYHQIHLYGKEQKECTLEDCPIGSMWYADWYSWKGPDGRSLYVKTPSGGWCIDGPSSNSKKPWTRTGTPPKVSAHPSINMHNYHGWLQDGVLSDDVEERKYPT